MKVVNKKTLGIVIIVLVLIEITTLFLMTKSFSNRNVYKEKQEYKVNKNMFSMYVEQSDGTYSEYEDGIYFPTEGYQINLEKSICVDTKENKVEGILSSKDDKITIASNKTVYCNIYFDILEILDVEFAYTGSYQEYEAKTSGYYYIETYGAQGGNSLSYIGGQGSKVSGNIYLNKGEKIYVYVGSQGLNGTGSFVSGGYNGGGGAYGVNSTYPGASGGGATDIRHFGNYEPTEEELIWNSSLGLNSRVMVAAGGGGGYYSGNGTIGGQLIGNTIRNNESTSGKQTSGGIAEKLTNNGTNGVFGIGGNGGQEAVGGGGAGYYGGAGASWASENNSGGASGSSFISGYGGVNAIKKDSGIRYIKDCTNGNSANTSNHWVELQAYVGSTNVAYGKPVYDEDNQSYFVLTDNNTDATQWNGAPNGEGQMCILLDLEKEYNIDKVTVWHYWGDGRSYNNHSMYVSKDNENWSALIDNRSGVAETSSGISAEVNKHTNNTLHYSGKYFINGKMEAGVNEGNGKAKISYIGKNLRKEDNKLDNVRYIKECIGKRTYDTCYTCRNFSEIQAIKNGVNVALNKTVNDNGVIYASGYNDPSVILDGDVLTSAVAFANSDDSLTCMIVDLEDIYDLDELFVGKFLTGNGVSFANHSIYVSSDNSNWHTILNNESGVSEYLIGKHFQTKYTNSNSFVINNGEMYTGSKEVKANIYVNTLGGMKYCITESDNSANCTWNKVNANNMNIDYTLSDGDGEKEVFVYLMNPSGNIVDTLSDKITFDTTAPSGNSVSINSGATYTTSRTVTLTLSSTGASQMCISNTSSCTNWVTYATSKSHTLATGDGSKTVYVWYKDAAGNTTDYVTDTITLDTVAPTNNSVIVNNNDEYTTSTSVTLKLSSTGASQMCISNTSSCTNWVTYATSKSHTLSNAVGTKTVYVWYRDVAGNISEVVSDTILLYEILTVPSQSGSLTYTGSSQSPTWSNYSSSKMTISGTTSGTNAGTYNATFTPKTNYIWSDGTTTAKTASWKINKAAGSLTLSASSGTITGVGNTKTFTVTRVGDGKISVSSSNTGVATVSVSGTTVTVKAVAAGSATITVSVAAGTNHTAPSSKTYSITVNTTLYLYNRGDKCTSVTGGWTQYRYGGAYWYEGIVTYNSDHVYFAAGWATMAAIHTTNKIDLTNYTQLGITMSTSGGSTILTVQSTAGLPHIAYANSTTSATVNISSLKGSYYIGVVTSVPDDDDEERYNQAWVYDVYLK